MKIKESEINANQMPKNVLKTIVMPFSSDNPL